MSPDPRYQDLPAEVERALSCALEALDLPLVALSHASGQCALEWMTPRAAAALSLEEEDGRSPAVTTRVATQLADAVCDSFDTSPLTSNLAELGVPFVLDVHGKKTPLRLAAVTLDDAKGTELVELLEQNESRKQVTRHNGVDEGFERIVETLPSGVWILRERRVAYANPSGSTLLHVDRSRLLGMDFVEFCVPEDVGVFTQNLERIEHGESVTPFECRVLTRDSRQLVVEFSCVTLEYDGSGAVLCFGLDVTQRKQVEQERLQADRLSALGLLAGGMAHALNNPLTYVVLNLDYVEPRLAKLASDSTELADCMKSLTEAREGAERMATVVKRMRGFARTEESATRPLDLRHVLESVVELVGHEIHHRGKLATRFEDVPPTIANESKLEQICLGLLLFATQMLPDDAAQRHAVRLSLETNEHHSNVIEIVCEGFTLESNRVEQLFDPFATTSDAKTRGYGLSVCRSLVEQLGGHLVAEPLPGTGLLLRTTFPCISVPRPPDSSRESLPPSTIPGSRSGRARILLIDDDPGVGHALELMLAGEHDVKCFEAPQAALRELLGDPNYDLVFCDLMMPKLSGIDLFEVLRYNRPGYEAKLVFMTGGAFTPANTRFLTQVPNPRIEKPFNLPVIRRLVQRAVRKRNEAVQG